MEASLGRKSFGLLWRTAVVAVCLPTLAAQADTSVKVLSFNIWGGGLQLGKPLDETVAVLRATGADVIGLQEVYRPTQVCVTESCADNNPSMACEIAMALAFYCHDQRRAVLLNGVNAVLSRYPITEATDSDLAVRINLGEQGVTVFNLHLADAPYQPYQLMRIAHGDDAFLETEAEAVAAASRARGAVLAQLERDLAHVGVGAVIITGDFNEPSFRDWTAQAAEAKRHPMAVAYPTTTRLKALGFTDSFRAVFPDEMRHPGFTWTTLPGPKDHFDRIDFIFAKGPGLQVETAAVVGEKSPEADIVITPWPSDHRAVLTTVRIGKGAMQALVR
jgi:exodeoxyribonuclease III